MAWTYSGDPSSNEVDKYRFLIGDTISSEPVLQDGEIQFVLDTYSSHNTRLYRLFDAAANAFAREFKKSLGPQSEDPTKRQEHFEKQAELYKKLSAMSGISLPVYSKDKIFRKGMNDNVRVY